MNAGKIKRKSSCLIFCFNSFFILLRYEFLIDLWIFQKGGWIPAERKQTKGKNNRTGESMQPVGGRKTVARDIFGQGMQ